MAQCKHWHNGTCKNCKKRCRIKRSLARKANKIPRKNTAPQKSGVEFAIAPPLLAETLSHGERVARLAGKIFSTLAPVYGISAPWATILDTAARLHDIGWMYGQKAHHKASARMIRAGRVEEVEKEIRPLVALVARYHRRAAPSSRQRRFAALSSSKRRGVRRMAAILRLADALDFSHADLVKDVEVVVKKNTILLFLDCPKGCAAEMERITAKKDLFQKVFKKEVSCQCKAQEALIPPSTQQALMAEEPTPAIPEAPMQTAIAMATPEE